MLIAADRTFASVGGGRLESRIIDRARAMLADGTDRERVSIDLTGREGAEGICGGRMQVALRCWTYSFGFADRERALLIAQAMYGGGTFELTPDDIGADEGQRLDPDPRLVIVGAGHCGVALAAAARALDYDVHVVDTRAEGYAVTDFPGATCHHDLPALAAALDTPRAVHAILLNRDWQADLATLRVLAERPPQFTGMMGSRKRIAEVLAALPDLADFTRTVHAPVGLEIGAETPEEIAISILAQLVAFARNTAA